MVIIMAKTMIEATIIPAKAPIVKPQQTFVPLSWLSVVNTSLDVSLQAVFKAFEVHPTTPQVLVPLNNSISQRDKLLAWQGALLTNLEITYS